MFCFSVSSQRMVSFAALGFDDYEKSAVLRAIKYLVFLDSNAGGIWSDPCPLS